VVNKISANLEYTRVQAVDKVKGALIGMEQQKMRSAEGGSSSA
jgi:hypothetical protein